jgi:hypothetical protein
VTKARQRERARRRLAERQALGITSAVATQAEPQWLRDKIRRMAERGRFDDALEECEAGLRRFGSSHSLLAVRGLPFASGSM